MMAIFRRASLLSIILLTPVAISLQVTPNSPCASLCMDDPSQDVSDPNTSNTYPSDIVCANTDLDNTPVGKKFESCVNCLRNSTASSNGENDQEWFLYNIRYALDSCLFGFTNVTDAQSTPCSMDTSCGPLQGASENRNLSPSNESTYSYCSADNSAFLGSSVSKCVGCLQDVSAESYLANFVVVLHAGCIQQPPVGTYIGIRGNIFSSDPLNVTFPGDDPWASSKASKKMGLSEGAIIGIVVGIVVLAAFAVALSFICYRKRRHAKSMKQLHSPLDSRFGSKSISSPISGAYSNPIASPPIRVSQPFDPSTLSPKELKALGFQMPNSPSRYPNRRASSKDENSPWQDAHAHLEATQGQLPSQATIPTHAAYIPATHAPVSPSSSTTTSDTYRMSSIPSSRSSPRAIPPSAASPAAAPASAAPRPGMKAILPPIQIPLTSPQTKPPSQVQQQPAQVPLHHPRQGTFQTAQPAMHLHLQQTADIHTTAAHSHSTMAAEGQRPPSRSNSISITARTLGRARSISRNGRNGRNGSTSRNGFRNTFVSMDVPVVISGPMIKHGGRFDHRYEWRDEGRRTRSGVADANADVDGSPDSVESEEQWPGVY